MHVIFITVGMCTKITYGLLASPNIINYYYRLDTATEEGFRHLEHHDTNS